MTEYRIHYYNFGRPRCNSPKHKSWTVDPDKVTCKNCLKLLKGEVK